MRDYALDALPEGVATSSPLTQRPANESAKPASAAARARIEEVFRRQAKITARLRPS